ncbi:hypothetical protein WA158_007995 [Blastocystis sp. Blastoise]
MARTRKINNQTDSELTSEISFSDNAVNNNDNENATVNQVPKRVINIQKKKDTLSKQLPLSEKRSHKAKIQTSKRKRFSALDNNSCTNNEEDEDLNSRVSYPPFDLSATERKHSHDSTHLQHHIGKSIPDANKFTDEWTETDIERLQVAISMYGEGHWTKISNYILFKYFIIHDYKHWSKREDEMLIAFANHHMKQSKKKSIPWGILCETLKTRTSKQCSCRWNYILNPAIKRGQIEDDEPYKLFYYLKKFGPNFKLIAKNMNGRKNEWCKSQLRSFIYRLKRCDIKDFDTNLITEEFLSQFPKPKEDLENQLETSQNTSVSIKENSIEEQSTLPTTINPNDCTENIVPSIWMQVDPFYTPITSFVNNDSYTMMSTIPRRPRVPFNNIYNVKPTYSSDTMNPIYKNNNHELNSSSSDYQGGPLMNLSSEQYSDSVSMSESNEHESSLPNIQIDDSYDMLSNTGKSNYSDLIQDPNIHTYDLSKQNNISQHSTHLLKHQISYGSSDTLLYEEEPLECTVNKNREIKIENPLQRIIKTDVKTEVIHPYNINLHVNTNETCFLKNSLSSTNTSSICSTPNNQDTDSSYVYQNNNNSIFSPEIVPCPLNQDTLFQANQIHKTIMNNNLNLNKFTINNNKILSPMGESFMSTGSSSMYSSDASISSDNDDFTSNNDPNSFSSTTQSMFIDEQHYSHLYNNMNYEYQFPSSTNTTVQRIPSQSLVCNQTLI